MDQDPQREDPHRPPVVFVFGPGASTMVASFQHLNSQVPGLLIMDTPSMYALRYLRRKGRSWIFLPPSYIFQVFYVKCKLLILRFV